MSMTEEEGTREALRLARMQAMLDKGDAPVQAKYMRHQGKDQATEKEAAALSSPTTHEMKPAAANDGEQKGQSESCPHRDTAATTPATVTEAASQQAGNIVVESSVLATDGTEQTTSAKPDEGQQQEAEPPTKKRRKNDKRGQYKNKERQQMQREERKFNNVDRLQTICLELAFWNRCESSGCTLGSRAARCHLSAPEVDLSGTTAGSSCKDGQEQQAGKSQPEGGSCNTTKICRRNHDIAKKLLEIKQCGGMPYSLPEMAQAAAEGAVEAGTEPIAFTAKSTSSGLEMAGEKKEDVVEMVSTGNIPCLVYRTNGFCPAGVNCLWAGDHVDLNTGENLFDWDKIAAKKAEMEFGKGRGMTLTNSSSSPIGKTSDSTSETGLISESQKQKQPDESSTASPTTASTKTEDCSSPEHHAGEENVVQQNQDATNPAVTGVTKTSRDIIMPKKCEEKSTSSNIIFDKQKDLISFIRNDLGCLSLQSGIHETNQLNDDIRNQLRRKKIAFPKSDEVVAKFHLLSKTMDDSALSNVETKNSSETATIEEKVDTNNESGAAPAGAIREGVQGIIANTSVDSTANTTTPTSPTSRLGAGLETSDRLHDLPRERIEKKKKIFNAKKILAPLTTVGNLPFRRLCVELGCEVTMSEMALAESILQGNNSELAMLRRHHSEKLFGIQITSGSAGAMTRCAEFLQNNTDCDWIDINAACPLDQLHTKGCGSILTVREKALRQMVYGMRTVLQDSNTLLSTKIRISHYDKCDRYNALKLLPKLAQWGSDAAILHGRTAKQRYTKLANWDYLKSCHAELGSQNCELPLVGCGDVLSYEQYERYLEENYVDSVMIGRGALIKPWIFQEITERRHIDLHATERLDLVKKYCQYGLEHWGSDERGRDTTRKFLLEWLSFFHRYLPVGLLEREYQGKMTINMRPPKNCFGRDDLETLLMSGQCEDWVKISEMFLGKCGKGFSFVPKHKSASYDKREGEIGGSAAAAPITASG